ncbi:MAG: hypothetical protein WA395_12870 [Nitrososphaeraceae archaeon]
MADKTNAKFRYYGISPFEIEIIYDVLKESFELQEEQLAPIDENIVSMVEIELPVSYDDSFFSWFSAERWFKIKEVLKEMTRRRGKRDIKIVFNFCGNTDDSPARVRFTLKGRNGREFEIAIEKIEYMVDIISMQLKTLSHIIDEVEYLYDENNHRWFPSISKADHGSRK